MFRKLSRISLPARNSRCATSPVYRVGVFIFCDLTDIVVLCRMDGRLPFRVGVSFYPTKVSPQPELVRNFLLTLKSVSKT